MEEMYNFLTALNKCIEFYEGYFEAKKARKAETEIIKEAESFSSIFDMDLYITTTLDQYAEEDALMEEIKNLFATPIKTVGDLIVAGKDLMSIKDRIECFEFWYC